VRSADGSAEVRLRSYECLADRGSAVAVGVGADARGRVDSSLPAHTGAGREEVERQARSTSRSAVSRTFVERTRPALSELMSRPLDDVRLAVMMIDGLELQGRCCVVALGISTESVKIPLGLSEGSTENAERARPPARTGAAAGEAAAAQRAWALDDHARGLEQLRALAGELDRAYPGAAASLREGTLTAASHLTSHTRHGDNQAGDGPRQTDPPSLTVP
jgi:hypothetical protein